MVPAALSVPSNQAGGANMDMKTVAEEVEWVNQDRAAVLRIMAVQDQVDNPSAVDLVMMKDKETTVVVGNPMVDNQDMVVNPVRRAALVDSEEEARECTVEKADAGRWAMKALVIMVTSTAPS